MDVKLVMAKGRPREHTIQLRSAETVIGRHRDCNLRIPSSDVSRRHCVLRFRDGRLYVEDLQSTNGTFVNGEPVKDTPFFVRPGDELGVGPVNFTVEYQAAAPVTAPTVADVSVPDVEVLDEEEEAVIVIDDTQDGELFNFDSEPINAKSPVPPKQGPAAKKADEAEVVDVEFDLEDQPLKLPEEGDLRDILSKLDH